MFAGLNGSYGILPNQPPPLTPEQEKASALEGVRKAAVRHAEAIRVAGEVPGIDLVPQALVDAILNAGGELDRSLSFAARRGATPADLAAVSGLHPSYVRELLTEVEKWPS